MSRLGADNVEVWACLWFDRLRPRLGRLTMSDFLLRIFNCLSNKAGTS